MILLIIKIISTIIGIPGVYILLSLICDGYFTDPETHTKIMYKNKIKEKTVSDLYYAKEMYHDIKDEGTITKIELRSGKTAICKLIGDDYECIRGFITDYYTFCIIGFEGEKLFKDMSYDEFLKSYYNEEN